jgi:aminoglycoside phosphotransferase (APT) family kinase protein
MIDDPEVIDVRPEEQLDITRLEPYLREHLPQTEGAFVLRQFGGGHANLTYLVRFGAHEYVLRRPPLGPVADRSHDMKREHKVLSKLYAFYPNAPRSFHLCADHAIIGSDFVIEERKNGIAIRKQLPQRYIGDVALARRISSALIDRLADLHRVDVAAAGLSELGRPVGYVQRQLDGWTHPP